MRHDWKLKVCALTVAFIVGIAAASEKRSQEALNQLAKDALSGSAPAANDLAYYFKDNEKARYFWISVAAENGDTSAQYNYWRRLSNHENPLLRARAVYWLRKSAESGDGIAQQSLRELEEGKELAPPDGVH